MYSPSLGWKHVLIVAAVFCAPLGIQAQQPQRPTQQSPVGTSNQGVPDSVRDAESKIERGFKKYGAGVRAGFAMDPELLDIGLHATLGPFFKENIAFRPNIEFAFGELTTMFALNLEAIYVLPQGDNDNRRFYVGAGPGFNFMNRGLEDQQTGTTGRDFNFDNFDYETSLNLLGGVEWNSGAFAEFKAAAYGGPTVRLLVGYTF